MFRNWNIWVVLFGKDFENSNVYDSLKFLVGMLLMKG